MSKIVFFNIPASGHILPAQSVIAELVRRGHQVIYYNTEATRAQVEPSGAEFRPYPANELLHNIANHTIGGGAVIVDNALQLTRIAEWALPHVIEVLRTEKPDLVLHDSLAAWGKYGQQPAAADLRAAVEQVLADLPTYKAAAKRLGDTFRSAGGYGRAADGLEKFAGGKR